MQKPNGKVICLMKHGSHLYGMNTPDSDMDYKGVFIPDQMDALLGLSKDELNFSTGNDASKNSADDIDVNYYSIGRFVKMLIKGETIAIDMIHCNEECLIESTNEWHQLVDMRSVFYTKNMNAFMGYVKKQAHKYGVRGSRIASLEKVIGYLEKKLAQCDAYLKARLDSRPEIVVGLRGISIGDEYVEYFPEGELDSQKPVFAVAGSKYSIRTPIEQVLTSLKAKLKGYGYRAKQAKENDGVDWKAMSHAIRCGYQLEEIYRTGDLKYPLKNREYLLSVKKGGRDFMSEVEPELNRIVDVVGDLARNSDLPDEVDSEMVWTKVKKILEAK